jgi:DNA ligase (NAD+)
MQPIEAEIKRLRSEIRRHDQLYYVDAEPEITDLQYDRLLEDLRRLESERPDLITDDSPTQRIGDAPVPHLNQIAHAVPKIGRASCRERV